MFSRNTVMAPYLFLTSRDGLIAAAIAGVMVVLMVWIGFDLMTQKEQKHAQDRGKPVGCMLIF